MIAAAIDVGTNSIKLLVAEAGRRLTPIHERVVITRLGEGLAETGRISEAAMARALNVLKACRRRAKNAPILAAGTEVLRKASNAADFVRRVAELGIELRVIDGREEGRLSRLGGISDWPDAATIEIGGGSTQISDGRRTVSIPIGAVTMTDRFLRTDPPTSRELDAARRAMKAALRGVRVKARGRVVSIGGTASTIGTMWTRGNFAKVHGLEIGLAELDAFLGEIAAETVAVRRRRKGLEPARADIIVAGGILLTEAMRHLGAGRITLSVRGLRHGLLMEAATSGTLRTRSFPSTPRRRARPSP
jgi:exopolyphosphatase/guanosine-5'-triphosphate,3'-diphosphate pyrophosphatase